MKKNYLIALAIMLSVVFAACSDSDKDHFNPKETEEYSIYGVEEYDLVGDVKTATQSFYSDAEWSEDGTTVEKGNVNYKYIYTFDQAGFLLKEEYYHIVGEKLKLQSVEEVQYDDRYRVTEWSYTGYDVSKAGTVVAGIEKNIYEYTDKEAILYLYTSEGADALEFISKTVVLLDGNGRADASYKEIYFAREKEEEVAAVAGKQRSLELSSTNKSLLHTSKDQKGNITLSYYAYEASSVWSEDVRKSLDGYYEQSLEYHDGTVSKAGELNGEMIGGAYVVSKLEDSDLLGKVKAFKSSYYSEAEWNEGTEKVEAKGVSSEVLTNVDDKGVLVNQIRSYWNGSTSKLEKESEIIINKYDEKFRITSQTQKHFASSEETTVTITYNDEKKTASLLETMFEDGEEVYSSNMVYKLAADGTISASNYDLYYENGEDKVRTNLVNKPEVGAKPDETEKIVAIKDANGNVTESYELYKYFDKNGKFVSADVEDYYKYEITYY